MDNDGRIQAIYNATNDIKNHLKGIKDALVDSNRISIFDIEFELNQRRDQLISSKEKSLETVANSEELSNYGKEMNDYCKERYENYLDAFDRLAFFILKKKLNIEYFNTEYKEMLSETIENSEFGDFKEYANRYRNMAELYEFWKEKGNKK